MVTQGHDDDFNRGDFAYNRYFGDPRNRPNPNLGAIARAPFYAVRIVPADVGTCGGVLTNEFGAVLREDGSTVERLFATGNVAAPVLGDHYVGAGASVAQSMVFGYLAVEEMARTS
jgi:3-oxosteroid 1-dehydrogenase